MDEPTEAEIKAAIACERCGVSSFYAHTRRCMELKGLIETVRRASCPNHVEELADDCRRCAANPASHEV